MTTSPVRLVIRAIIASKGLSPKSGGRDEPKWIRVTVGLRRIRSSPIRPKFPTLAGTSATETAEDQPSLQGPHY